MIIQIPMSSIHIDNNPVKKDQEFIYYKSGRHTLCQENPGLIAIVDGVRVGVYKNSFYRYAWLVGYEKGNTFGWSVNLVTGYNEYPVLLPTLFARYDNMRIDVAPYSIEYDLNNIKGRAYGLVFGFSLEF